MSWQVRKNEQGVPYLYDPETGLTEGPAPAGIANPSLLARQSHPRAARSSQHPKAALQFSYGSPKAALNFSYGQPPPVAPPPPDGGDGASWFDKLSGPEKAIGAVAVVALLFGLTGRGRR